MWEEDCDGEGTPGWCDWYDEGTGEDDPIKYIESIREGNDHE